MTKFPKLKITFILIFLFGIFGLAKISQAATTYYVCNTSSTCGSGWSTGSDSYNGTAKTYAAPSTGPYKTIQKCADVVNPGDTCIVGNGTYTDTNSDTYIIRVTRGGTSGDWITFKSENKWGAKLDGQSNTAGYGIIFGSGVNYVRIQDFEIFGLYSAGIHSNAAGHDMYFVGNKIHDIGRRCYDSDYGQNAIYFGVNCYNHTADSNVIYSIGRFAPGEQGCNPSTAYYKNHDHGVYTRSSNHLIENNIFYLIERGWAIHLYGGTQDNVKIINNTFVGPNPYNNGHILISSGSSNLLIENNIFFNPLNWALQGTQSNSPDTTIRNNLVYGATIAQSGHCDGVYWFCSANITGNPLFVDLPNSDYHLQNGSPAIDAGLLTYCPSLDYGGNTRPEGGGCDIGAYEYVGGADTTPPAAPQGLTVK